MLSPILRRIPLFLDTHALLRSQYWSREKLLRYQEARLKDVLTHAMAVPYWAEMFKQHSIDTQNISHTDLARLPITTKADMKETSLDIIDHAYESQSYTDHTSGSTGEPFTYLHDAGYVLRMFAVCERLFRTAGSGTRYTVLSMRTRERKDFAFVNSEHFFVRGYNALSHRLSAFVETTSQFKEGFIIYSFPSVLSELARLVAAQRISVPLKAVISTAEDLSTEQKERIETQLGVKVYGCYGTRELGGLTFECDHGRSHLNEESSLTEIVDEDGRTLSDGSQGRVVVTPFDHRVMPFIRYFTGDIGVIDTTVCPCGRTLRTIMIKGREAHFIDLGLRRVPLLEVSSIFDMYAEAIRHYQIAQRGPLTFVMRVVPGELFEERKIQLRDMLISVLDTNVTLTWEIVETIPPAKSGKAQYFVREF